MNSVPFVRYQSDGQVTEFGTMAPDVIEWLKGQGDRVLAGEGGLDHFVDISTFTLQPKNNNPSRLVGMTLLELPIPSTVKIGRSQYVVIDGWAELEFPLPGTYRVEVSAVRYLTKTFEVTA